ncbi:hypothetical protein ACEWY4_012110 [Coilia grayii]|uniref:Ig-like domain-containing protein n=1 Tax=Coilia grayii TaxID=363190 RepID=A0ABD1JZK3_9TELE
MVVMLDDLQLSYYGFNVRNYTYYKSENECAMPGSAAVIFGDFYNDIKALALFTKQQLNLTYGLHVHQTVTGCELHDNGTSSYLGSWTVFNGVPSGRVQFNTQDKSFHSEGLVSKIWGHIERKSKEMFLANVYLPICISNLKNCLQKRKNDVMRKVKPRVRLFQKTLPDSRGTRVTCLATGFYPRHINLTLLRDGQPVPDHQVTGGELLPNRDGTYQMRKSLEVRAEELREKHHYTCTAEHLSLDNKLDIGLGNFLNKFLNASLECIWYIHDKLLFL